MSFTKKFNEEFEKLNLAQREAAETIEGPLLIVAGPGTGKTQTLALRLANILKQTQAKPHNLLALTFTESGAIALKKRLASIIGSDAYGISAFTFHAFCARIHSTFPSEFATTRERIQIDQLRQLQLFTEILKKGEFPLLAPLRAPDLYLRDLSGAISSLKREGITSDRLREILEGEQEELNSQERINPRTKKPYGKILQKEKQIAKNFELVTFYENYQTELEEKGFTDFDDLILSVVEKLNPALTPQISERLTVDESSSVNSRVNSDTLGSEDGASFLLAYLQENFLYATVDEFQDTNGAQNEILRAWGSFDEKPNLCVVGDDDQSIYRFQGASLANILEFHESFPAAKIITLTENYRSTQPILDAASAVIVKNEERLVNKIEEVSKTIQAVGSSQSAAGSKKLKPRIIEAMSEADEVASVGGEIQKLMEAKTPLHEIAVIYRNRAHGNMLAEFLQRKGIPFFRADGLNALLNSRVKQLVRLLQAIENPKDALNSLASFFADFAGIPEVEVYKISKEVNLQKTFLDVALESEIESVKNFAKKLISFQKMKAEQNLLELVENVSAESGLNKKIVKNKEFESAEAITAFFNFVRNFSVSHEEASLKTMIEDLKAMEKNSLPIRTPSRAHEAITLTTAHSAKGLEWENVFIIHADDNSWGGKGKRQMLKLPNLLKVEEEKDASAERIEDERRLFFVALTRAKKNLIITSAREYGFREVATSRFIAEIPSDLIEKVEAESSELENLPITGTQEFSEDTKRFLQSLLENFRLSPTALNAYLACPRKFLFQNLLRIPAKVEASDRMGAIFGSAIHAGLEEFFREFKQTGKLPSAEVAIRALKKSFDREPLTMKQRANLERDAVPAIEKYLEFHTASFAPPAEVEFNFAKHEVRLDSIPLTGKVDRIDAISQTKDQVRFIDYKSQKPYSRAAIQGETANSTGDAYRQLLFYLLLAELDSRFIFHPTQVVLSFVRENDAGEFQDESFTPQKEEIEQLKKTIQETWGKIQNLEFSCEDCDCSRCDFRSICEK